MNVVAFCFKRMGSPGRNWSIGAGVMVVVMMIYVCKYVSTKSRAATGFRGNSKFSPYPRVFFLFFSPVDV